MDDRERTLDPRVVIGWRVTAGSWSAIVLGGAVFAVYRFFPGLGLAAAGVAVAVWAAWVAWYPGARIRRWSWRLGGRAIELRHGVFVHRHDAVPYFRIQQIDLSAGPIDRVLGITSLSVDLRLLRGRSATLPGITAELAPALREELLARAEASLRESDDQVRDGV